MSASDRPSLIPRPFSKTKPLQNTHAAPTNHRPSEATTHDAEWIRDITAECHYRTHLRRSHWDLWRRYVWLCAEKRQTCIAADRYYNCRILRICLKAWFHYVDLRRTKMHLTQAANSHYESGLKDSIFRLWISSALMFRRYRLRIQSHLKKRAYRKLKLVFSMWRTYARLSKSKRRKKAIAYRHYRKRILSQYLYRFALYIRIQVDQEEKKILAYHHLYVRVLRKYLVKWIHYCEIQAMERRKFVTAEDHDSKRIMRIAFFGLKKYVQMRNRRFIVSQRALAFRQKMSMRRALHILSYYCKYEKQIVRSAQDARFIASRLSKRIAFTMWRSAFDNRIEFKLQSKMLRAATYRSQILLQRAFSGFLRYHHSAVVKKRLNQRAVNARSRSLLKSHFQAWEAYVKRLCKIRDIGGKLTLLQELKAKSDFYYIWMTIMQEQSVWRTKEHLASQHYRKSSLRKAIKRWRNRILEIYTSERLHEIATEHQINRLLKFGISAFIRYVKYSKETERKRNLSIRHPYHCLLRWGLCALRQNASQNMKRRRQSMIASSHNQERLLKFTFRRWKDHLMQMQCLRISFGAALKLVRRRILRSVWTRWNSRGKLYLQERRAEIRAHLTHNRRLLFQSFHALRIYSLLRGRKKTAMQDRINNYRSQLQELQRARIFRAWISWQRRKLVYDLAKIHARSFHHRKILHRHLILWCIYVVNMRRKKVLLLSATTHRNAKLMLKGLRIWKKYLVCKRKCRLGTKTAIEYWARRIYKSCFHNWIHYIQSRHEKKIEEQKCLEVYRKSILKRASGLLVEAVVSIQETHEREVIQFHTEKYRRLMNIVRRCARHWRAVVLQRRVRKQAAPDFSSPYRFLRHHEIYGKSAYPASAIPSYGGSIVEKVTRRGTDSVMVSRHQPAYSNSVEALKRNPSTQAAFPSSLRPPPRRPVFSE